MATQMNVEKTENGNYDFIQIKLYFLKMHRNVHFTKGSTYEIFHFVNVIYGNGMNF